ncbi:hypothetical protein FN846DRAFT_906372 [Sphaerosporella brunnea]|uniref:Uncharacterized protein n=1 Tax=Sphaerosporella brunnea TaxID=1250544 RepID=A0A5J5EZR6_9PEZI|nr:hypothetical protein FN846DRAFT_906372 [Sphaerosporella brunnea]
MDHLKNTVGSFHDQTKLAVCARLAEILSNPASRDADAAKILVQKFDVTIVKFQADCELQFPNSLEAKLAVVLSMITIIEVPVSIFLTTDPTTRLLDVPKADTHIAWELVTFEITTKDNHPLRASFPLQTAGAEEWLDLNLAGRTTTDLV